MAHNADADGLPAPPPDAEEVLRRFEDAWLAGVPPSVEDALAALAGGDEPSRRALLEELIKIDFEYRARGQRPAGAPASPPRLEEYLRRFPQLSASDELIAAEYRVRHLAGERPSAADYAGRFGRPVAELRVALAAVADEAAAEFPIAPPVPPALPAAPVVSVGSLLEDLRATRLLKPAQLNEVITEDLRGRFPDPSALGRRLLEPDWLTAYQVNQLVQGRARDLLLGAYVVLGRLGAGSFSQVFKARHQAMNRLVALKIIRQERLVDIDAATIQRFYREVQAAAQLSHPNVVHAFDAGPTGTTHFLAMEFVDGTDLSRLVQRSGPVAVDRACDYIRQAACGLAHAHERGLVHRDIKPSNLLVSSGVVSGGAVSGEDNAPLTTPYSPLTTHQIKVADFGLASLRQGSAFGSTLTREGDVMGTADYMAPEQAVDPRAVDIRGDLYSLGCTFYYLLTGQPPFGGGTFIQKLQRHQWEEPAPVTQLRPDTPPHVAALVHRLLAKRPEDRFQTPVELAEALAAEEPARADAIVAVTTHAPPPPVASADGAIGAAGAAVGLTLSPPPSVGTVSQPTSALRGARRPRRNQLVFLGTGLCVVGLVLLGTVLSNQFRRPRPTSAAHVASPTLLAPAKAPLDELRADHIHPADLKAAGNGDPTQVPAGLVGIFRYGESSPQGLHALAFTADGKLLAGGTGDGKVVIWDCATGRELRRLAAHQQAVLGLAFHPKGDLLASAGLDWVVKLWDPHTGREVETLAGHRDGVRAVAFSPGGTWLATAGNDHRVLLWTVKSRKEVRPLVGHDQFITSLAFSPDGLLLASASDDRTVRLWHPATGKPGHRIARHENQVSAVAFSPDGQTLASASWDNTIRLTDPATGQERRTCNGHNSQVYALSYSADGQTLASGSLDGTVRLWDPAVGAETRVIAFAHQGDFVRNVAFAPDGRHLAVATRLGTVDILRLAPPPTGVRRPTPPPASVR